MDKCDQVQAADQTPSDQELEEENGNEHDLRLKTLFNSAANYLTILASSLDSDTLLYLYARYKQSIVGSCNTSKPSFFNFQAKQKWEAWNNLGGKSKKDAMTEYVNKIRLIDPNWKESGSDFSSTQSSSTGGSGFGGPVVSTLMNNMDANLDDKDKTIFDWVKEGNLKQLKRLNSKPQELNCTDEMGMSLLHWAADRGHEPIVEYLLQNSLPVDIKDSDSQTPLHYASSCGHFEMVKLLLRHNADQNLTDDDGLKPVQVAANDTIAELFSN